VVQPPPAVPQEVIDAGMQTFALQHPFGHDVASQKHVPCMQCWPAGH
jgi:hypothetical protein